MSKPEGDPNHRQGERTLRTLADAERALGKRRPLLKLRFYDDPIEFERSFEAPPVRDSDFPASTMKAGA
jgi:hypothetical protein